ncbi:MAG: Cd(II)/Pb(II)-responsive transcriptional regulator [Burkholderiales bacterium]|nr:Cd(II)/Pb(II)-responsive transcriptional regulator [Burkholderiales bacterium]
MRIGELSRDTGVDIQTVRYYEKAGLLLPPTREANGYRAYGPAHLERLAFIRHCRALDMPLADVRRLLEFMARPDADCGDVNRLIDGHLARVRARLASMRALEKQLAALRAQCETNHAVRECGILDELVAAAHGEACACHETDAAPPTDSPKVVGTLQPPRTAARARAARGSNRRPAKR